MLSERSPILYDLISMWNLERKKETNKIIEKEARLIFARGGLWGKQNWMQVVRRLTLPVIR